jgi:hypothetical protein
MNSLTATTWRSSDLRRSCQQAYLSRAPVSLGTIDRTAQNTTLSGVFIMCRYTTADIIFVQCQRPTKHRIAKRLYKRCQASPKPGPRCENATYDSALGTHLPSTRNAPCKFCRDSGVSVGGARYKDVSCTQSAYNKSTDCIIV